MDLYEELKVLRLKMKRIAGRDKDLLDIRELEALREGRDG